VGRLHNDYRLINAYVIKKYGVKSDRDIVTPCEIFMEDFLRLFREKYGDTENYFRSMGLSDKEIQA